jgi:hypothetical protein
METTKNKTVESKKPNLPKKEQQKNFVKVRDLSEDQFKNLDRIKCTLKKTVSKKGFTRCSLDIVIDKTLFITSIQLPDVRFNYLRLKLNFDVFDRNGREIYDYTFMAPY